MSSSGRVLAVIVGHRQRADVLAAVAAVRAQRPWAPAVLVVDNASDDGTANAVRQAHPDAMVLSLAENTGGAGGFAAGMRRALAEGYDWCWLIDGDACPQPGALEALLAATTDPQVAVVAAQIVMRDRPQMVQEIGAGQDALGRPRFIAAFAPCDPGRPRRRLAYAAACSCLVRCAAMAEVGTVDPGLFLFYDDIWWCHRMRRAGYRIVSAPAAVVEHRWHGAKAPSVLRSYYGIRNELLYQAWRGQGPWGLVVLALWLARAELRQHRWQQQGWGDQAAATAQAVADALAGRLGRRHEHLQASPAGSHPPPPLVRPLVICDGELARDLFVIEALLAAGIRPVVQGTGPIHRLLAGRVDWAGSGRGDHDAVVLVGRPPRPLPAGPCWRLGAGGWGLVSPAACRVAARLPWRQIIGFAERLYRLWHGGRRSVRGAAPWP